MAKQSFILNLFGLDAYQAPQFDDITEPGYDEIVATSQLGTPLFDNLVLKDNDKKTEIELRIDTVLMEVDRPKIIKKVRVQGRNGTDKVFISHDDYQITIRGAIVGIEPFKRPLNDFAKLVKLCDLSHEIAVESRYLNALGVYYIVVERPRYLKKEGEMNTEYFELNCVSDTPLEVTINEESELQNNNA